MPRCRKMTLEEGIKANIGRFPNFSRTGSITGMKKQFYGENALLVRCGSYIYHVDQTTYDKAQ